MGKKIIRADEIILSQLKETLKKKYACYVLITCSSAADDGRMNVEMHFDGDEDLAGLLVENAAQAFQEPHRESQ